VKNFCWLDFLIHFDLGGVENNYLIFVYYFDKNYHAQPVGGNCCSGSDAAVVLAAVVRTVASAFRVPRLVANLEDNRGILSAESIITATGRRVVVKIAYSTGREFWFHF